MKTIVTVARVVSFLAAVSCIFAQNVPTVRPRTGYLSASEAPDVTKIVPPAPVPGDHRDDLDLSIFRATRIFEGSPRWTLARSDNDISASALMKTYSCAAGASLDADKTPKLAALLGRALTDATGAFNRVKNSYPERRRPFLVEQGPVCIASQALANNPDYPSGHTVLGWTVGTLLAELRPEQATDVLIRARAFGESRVICGVHDASAIEVGRIVAESIVAALHANSIFRSDVESARAELSVSGLAKPDDQTCKAEAELLMHQPY